ncbi:MAG: hypothetical protein MI717_05245 [Spirochaetales bacterium]|nr:hypothetical protein [Spirochaetales bacterium]
MVILILILFHLFGHGILIAQDSVIGKNREHVAIEWEEVTGAASYRIQVRRDGIEFIDTKVLETRLGLDLAPGNYEYRIFVLNPFGGEAARSPWKNLRVERAATPYFRVPMAQSVPEGSGILKFSLEELETESPVEYWFLSGENEVLSQKENSILSINTESLEPGLWDVEARAASGLRFSVPGVLTITAKPEPQPEETSELIQAYQGKSIAFSLEGTGFYSGMEIQVLGEDGELPIHALVVKNAEMATVYLDAREANPGKYTLNIMGGKEGVTRSAGTLLISPPPVLEEQEGDSQWDIMVGLAPFAIIRTDVLTAIPGLLNAEFVLSVRPGAGLKFWSGFSGEGRIQVGMTSLVPDQNGNTVHGYFAYDTGFSWRPTVNWPLVPILGLGIGNIDSQLAQSFNMRNLLYFRGSVGTLIGRKKNRFYIGANVMVGFTEDIMLPIVSLSALWSYRL